MSSDHSIYFEEGQNLLDVIRSPGFPHVRLHPAVLDPSRIDEFSPADEILLLAMHLQANQLLVISNKSISIYLIPQLKSKLQTAGSIGLKVGIGMIPIVGDLLDAGEKLLKPVEWIKAGRQRKKDKVLAAEGMPTNEEINNMAWDFRDPDTLKLIQIYKEKILLKNGFKWRMPYRMSLEDTQEQILITVEEKGIRITIGRKEIMNLYLDQSWEPLKVAGGIIEQNRLALEAMGCTIETADQKFIFKKVPSTTPNGMALKQESST